MMPEIPLEQVGLQRRMNANVGERGMLVETLYLVWNVIRFDATAGADHC
jgi:hypothetical protein